MKRKLLVILALCMALCMLFASCAEPVQNGASNDNQSGNTTSNNNNGNTDNGTTNNGGGDNGPKNDQYTREGNKIYFGSYPQTKVSDTTLISTLNTKAGTLPEKDAPAAWTEYGYFVPTPSQKTFEYMWYIDVTEGENTYRGIYMKYYRPYSTDRSESPSTNYTNQNANGYSTATVYWFKYEPIAWTVLDEANGNALIVCDLIIDSQPYSTSSYSNSSDYSLSTIRAWLNDNFYNTAFNELEKQFVLKTTVDNSLESTTAESNAFICDNTEDYVFLLSRKEAKTVEYFADNAARTKTSTDYAKSQGLQVETDGTSGWWLRTPSTITKAAHVRYSGPASWSETTWYTEIGIVPAITIKL